MRLFILFLLTCSFVGTLCTKPPCDGCQSMIENARIKRAKYYSSPPQRFYKRPPNYPAHGSFSYTPPPSYTMDDEEQLPTNHRPSKYSKRPTNEGLGDEDINNIIKYLSKKDLSKIVEFAALKDKHRDLHYDRSPNSKPEYTNEDHFQPDNGQRFSLNGPYINPNDGYKNTNNEYPNPNTNFIPESKPIKVLESDSQNTPDKVYFSAPLEAEETVQNQQFAVVDAYIQQEINGMGNERGANIFTDSKVIEEERLPTPVNLRHHDYDASFTNNVPAVVKPGSSSYKIENFGSLPLMNYNSKLRSVNSYNVPHYTVTSPNRYQPPSPLTPLSPSPSALDIQSPPFEKAPSITNYRDQSDAHLKAIKIWTHKSRGTAYTLHDDGSLSLERPHRPKPKYG